MKPYTDMKLNIKLVIFFSWYRNNRHARQGWGIIDTFGIIARRIDTFGIIARRIDTFGIKTNSA